MFKKTLLAGTLLLCIVLALSPLHARDSTTLKITHTPAQYDSIIASWRWGNLSESLENYVRDYIILDTTTYITALGAVTDTEYKRRLNGIVSPIHLPFNDIVRKHLIAYTTTHKRLSRQMLGDSQYYFPIIERELEKADLPLELKFLPVIESSLQAGVSSPAGAVGLWQFTLNTGRHYGLEINSMIDQRRDPIASTRAACAYLKDLYKIYEDWTLVIASYNYGPGNVNRALKRAGAKASTYWDIYPYLPSATRDYIPAFVGLTYVYHYHSEHNIRPATPRLPLATDTVMIHQNLHFKQVSSTLNIPLELLRLLNPQYKQEIIPGATKEYPLVLPQSEITNFIGLEKSIYGQDSLYVDPNLATSVVTAPRSTSSNSSLSKTHTIRKGDTLGSIAKRYSVSVKQLTAWNKLKSNSTLRIGQKIKLSAQ